MFISNIKSKILLFLINLHVISVAIHVNSNATDSDVARPVVKISSGSVKGSVMQSRVLRRDYYSFRGIPFAKPPVGNLRFKHPLPTDSWNGVLDATDDNTTCAQYNFITKTLDGHEDCLVLNVYTHQLPADGKLKLPVLVFIHGGGFILGTGGKSWYGPSRYMDEDVVLVTVNYRLGVLGFLSTADEHAPGNYGMHDQVLALKWIQNNIDAFGGDPERVTIFGESAGAASVIFLVLSPAAKGLFHAAISQSGTALCSWAIQEDPLPWTQKIAAKVSCPTDDHSEMMKCLSTVSFEDLVLQTNSFMGAVFWPLFMGPVVEKPTEINILTESPLKLITKGKIANKVPLIMGITSDEGYIFYKDYNRVVTRSGQDYIDNDLVRILSPFLNANLDQTKRVMDVIQKEYFDGHDLDNETDFMYANINILSDIMFGSGVQETVEMFSKQGIPVYAYHYSHVGKHAFAELFGGSAGIYSSHADELFMQFDFLFAQTESVDPTDARMSAILNKLWTNFAYLKKPMFNGSSVDDNTLEWKPYDESKPEYVDLGINPVLREGLLCERSNFWTEVVPELIQKAGRKDEF